MLPPQETKCRRRSPPSCLPVKHRWAHCQNLGRLSNFEEPSQNMRQNLDFGILITHTKNKKIVTTPFSQYPKMCHVLDIRGTLLAKNELFILKPKILFYSKLITIQGFGNKVEFFRLYLHKQRFSFFGHPQS